MKQVASLRYDVIFKKAFRVPAIFTALVRDFLNIELDIDSVETDKVYDPPLVMSPSNLTSMRRIRTIE
ncbi:MAG: hypothetical protein HC877_16785 [Thioploca sp.]|nr:hypothetical protein [Thioploca sp.]